MARQAVDACLAVTEALADEASRRGLGPKALAITAGCDTESFRPSPSVRARVRAAMGLQSDDILILHLGWAWHRKGGDLLVAAAEQLQQRGHTGLIFASVGATGAGSSLVRSLPFTDRVHELHQAADIFVSSSRSEGFGNGVVEAMATGTVVVAAQATGQREIFEGVSGCVAVAVDDPLCLADGIADLIARRNDWPTLGAMNRAHILARYDMRDWACRMADVYERMLSMRAVRP
jgi:glycosyltransferase involved in cell wall biosynthesis